MECGTSPTYSSRALPKSISACTLISQYSNTLHTQPDLTAKGEPVSTYLPGPRRLTSSWETELPNRCNMTLTILNLRRFLHERTALALSGAKTFPSLLFIERNTCRLSSGSNGSNA